MQTTQEKRRAKLDRQALFSLRAALCPESGREKLGLTDSQREHRDRLQRGKSHTFVGLVQRNGQPITRKYKTELHGKLAADECRAVQPAVVEPALDLLWADLTPHQRKALRKYRAGKKREREIALALRQMRQDGCRGEAARELNAAIKLGDHAAAAYWRRRLAQLRGH